MDVHNRDGSHVLMMKATAKPSIGDSRATSTTSSDRGTSVLNVLDRGAVLSTIINALILVRIINLIGIAVIAAACVLWTGFVHWGPFGAFAFVAGYLALAAGGYAINDVHDVSIDKIAHPLRPLPRSLVSVQTARVLSGFLFLVGNLLLSSIGWQFLVAAPIITIVLCLYSVELKVRSGLMGNIVVAAIVSTIPFLAGLYSNNFDGIWFIVAIGFGTSLSREVLKDIEDTEGDKRGHRRTLSTQGNYGAAAYVVTLGIMLVSTATVGMFFLEPRLGTLGIVASVGLVALLVTMLLLWILRPQSLKHFQRAIWCSMFCYAVLFLLAATW